MSLVASTFLPPSRVDVQCYACVTMSSGRTCYANATGNAFTAAKKLARQLLLTCPAYFFIFVLHAFEGKVNKIFQN